MTISSWTMTVVVAALLPPNQEALSLAERAGMATVDGATATAPERLAPAPLQPELEKLGFDQVIRRALVHNSSAVIAAEEVRRADGLLWQARSGSLPSLTATGTFTHLNAPKYSGNNVTAAQDQIGANLTVTVPIVVPARWYQWIHGSQSLDVARASELDVRRTVAITTGRAYLTVIAQRRALAVVLRARDNAKAHYEFSHARRVAGTGNALDELRADQQQATLQAQVEQAYATLNQAREALGIITGSNGPLDAAEEPELPSPAEPDQALREAEENRQDVKAGRARAHAAARVSQDGWSDWLPTLLASMQGTFQDPPPGQSPQTGWQAQLVLSWPLFVGGQRVGQARERAALSRQAEAQLELLLRQARADVRLAWEAMMRSQNAYRESKRAAERAGSVLQLATQAYKSGALTSLDVIDAERQARDAETVAIVAEDAVRQSRLNLLAATGRFP